MLTFIKKTNRRMSKSKKYMVTYNLYFCSYCKKEVELPSGTKTESCGCHRYQLVSISNKKHGFCAKKGGKNRLYRIWSNMKTRCLNPKAINYKRYGGRGISVCEEWKKSFISFKSWSDANGYKDNLCIDRIDNNGNYDPENCKFVTNAKNCQNQRTTKLNWNIVRKIRKEYILDKKRRNYKGSQYELADRYNVSQPTIEKVINNITWRE